MQHKAAIDTRILFIDVMCLICGKDTKFFGFLNQLGKSLWGFIIGIA